MLSESDNEGGLVDNKTVSKRRYKYIAVIALVIVFVFLLPARVENGKKIIQIRQGTSLSGIATQLKSDGIIRSATYFKILARVGGSADDLKAGTYIFAGWNTTPTVLTRIVKADYQVPIVKVVIPEGLSNRQVARLLKESFSGISIEVFADKAKENEGYLFPDTYDFYETANEEEFIKVMREHFDKKVEPLKDIISKSKYSLHDIVTMASLIEKEAANPTDRRIISGILWKRLSIGMALQVDAVFPYILDKNKSLISLDDLKIKSPYNTYLNRGLPPGPINNPSLDAIMAALEPTESKYLYYLSDPSGVNHYAKSFEEHKRNKEQYLR